MKRKCKREEEERRCIRRNLEKGEEIGRKRVCMGKKEVQKSKNGSIRIKGVQGKKAHRVKWVLKKEGGI